VKRFAVFFGLQGLNYLVVSIGIRALAQGLYAETIVTDLMLGVIGFTLIKRVAEAKGKVELVGYTLGGTAGSALAIFITRAFWGS